MANNWTQIDDEFSIKFEEPEIKPEIKAEIKEEPVDDSAKENQDPQSISCLPSNPVSIQSGEDTDEIFSRQEIQKIVEVVGLEKWKIILSKLDVAKIGPHGFSRQMKNLCAENFRLQDMVKVKDCQLKTKNEAWKSLEINWKNKFKTLTEQNEELEAQMNSLKRQKEELQAQMNSLKKGKEQLEVLLEVNSSKLNLLQSEANSTKDELVRENEAKTNRLSKNENLVRILKCENERFKSKKESKIRLNESLKVSNESLKGKLKSKDKEIVSLKRKLNDQEMESLKVSNESLKRKLNTKDKEIVSLKRKLNDQEIESLRKLKVVTSEKEELKLKNEALKMYVNQHVCGDETVKTEPGQSGSIQSYLESLELGQSLLKKKRQ